MPFTKNVDTHSVGIGTVFAISTSVWWSSGVNHLISFPLAHSRSDVSRANGGTRTFTARKMLSGAIIIAVGVSGVPEYSTISHLDALIFPTVVLVYTTRRETDPGSWGRKKIVAVYCVDVLNISSLYMYVSTLFTPFRFAVISGCSLDLPHIVLVLLAFRRWYSESGTLSSITSSLLSSFSWLISIFSLLFCTVSASSFSSSASLYTLV